MDNIQRTINALKVSKMDGASARYHLMAVNKGSFDNDSHWYADDTGNIKPAWNRKMKAIILQSYGVPVDAFKQEILRYIIKYPSTLDNLGLIEILESKTAELPEIIVQVNHDDPVTSNDAVSIFLDYALGKYSTLEEASLLTGIPIKELEAV
jgi:hypothetical protein